MRIPIDDSGKVDRARESMREETENAACRLSLIPNFGRVLGYGWKRLDFDIF